ncbi:MAG: PAS domain-containing protein [Proteobacteria bacterium]|nr:PAS domain-containing protein [Pseudomonadota bacterium]
MMQTGSTPVPLSASSTSIDTLQAVLDEIGHPVVLLTATGQIVQANQAATRIFDDNGDFAPGKFCPLLVAREDTPKSLDYLSAVIATGTSTEGEIWRFGRWWNLVLVPLRNLDGEVRRIGLFAEDVTQRKKEQAARLEQERALARTLVREAHHRIKNQLQGLIGLLRGMKDAREPYESAIDAAVGRVASIAAVHCLLTRERDQPLRFLEIVRHTVLGMRTESPIPIDISVGAKRDLLLTEEDAIPLALIVGELLMNAMKHTERCEDAQIEVSLKDFDAGTELAISNTPALLPVGFSREERRHIHDGLDLVSALLPRSATLQLSQHASTVLAVLTIRES